MKMKPAPILDQLYHGEINPWEQIKPMAPEYGRVNEKITQEIEHFTEILPADEARRFERLQDLLSESSNLYAQDCFQLGFCLGCRLIVEVCDQL